MPKSKSIAVGKGIAPAIAIALFVMSWLSPSRAVDRVELTQQQKDLCTALNPQNVRFCLAAHSVKVLSFPTEIRELSAFSSTAQMGIFKPEGDGPFPAILVLHNCGKLQEPHIRYWVKNAIERGYVVFIVDSWSQRGLPDGVCSHSNKNQSVNFPEAIPVRVRDAFEALKHLSKFKVVDSSRVGAIGFSHGGRVSYHLASNLVSRLFAPGGEKFASVVSVYGECFSRPLNISHIRPDINVPLFSLLSDKDEDGDPRECLPRFAPLKEKGAPVSWHVFPLAGHAWDNPAWRTPTKLPYAGSPSGTVYYAYDEAIADQSRDMAFAHFERSLKVGR